MPGRAFPFSFGMNTRAASPLVIWCNTVFCDAAARTLREDLARRGHTLVTSNASSAAVLRAGGSDRDLLAADIAFGQPDVGDCLASSRLRWLEVSTGGYARYDTEAFREHLLSRRIAFTNASSVFADSCAQHALAFILSSFRQLPASMADQLGDRRWEYTERRYRCRRLTGATVLLLGFGAIGRRLRELLAPFGCQLLAVRRQSRSEEGVRIVPVEDLTRVLPLADIVVNILPDNEGTRGFVNARRFACMKAGALFVNVGRGVTVDQRALCEALTSGRLGGACLDVTEPEPLPPQDPLWEAPNCIITPHIAGGRADQDEALVAHFLENLSAFEAGGTLVDRIV